MNTAAFAVWASITRTRVPTVSGAVIALVVGLDPEFAAQLTAVLRLASTAA